jgi:hypothetical protein
MPIYRLLAGSSLRPEEIAVLNDAYERALQAMSLVDRNHPLTEIVAKKVIEIGRTEIDPVKISQLAVQASPFHEAAPGQE